MEKNLTTRKITRSEFINEIKSYVKTRHIRLNIKNETYEEMYNRLYKDYVEGENFPSNLDIEFYIDFIFFYESGNNCLITV